MIIEICWPCWFPIFPELESALAGLRRHGEAQTACLLQHIYYCTWTHKHMQNHKIANCMSRCQTASPDCYLHLQLQTKAHSTLYVPKRYEITVCRHSPAAGNHGLHWHNEFSCYNHGCTDVTILKLWFEGKSSIIHFSFKVISAKEMH